MFIQICMMHDGFAYGESTTFMYIFVCGNSEANSCVVELTTLR